MTIKKRHIIIGVLLIIAIQAGVLFWLGHSLICPCGSIKIWDGVIKGPENSQQLLDWYSFSHLIYGFILYFFFWLARKKLPVSFMVALLLVVALSAGWEMFENTHYAINHYKVDTISSDYYGDSIVNSVMDTACLVLGFWLASLLPIWLVVFAAIALEIAVFFIIHDNLALNMLMFLWPIKSVQQWQAAMSP